jgi:hypothetical protein
MARCFCGERNKMDDDRVAKIACFMESITGWLVKVKGMGLETGHDEPVSQLSLHCSHNATQ